MKIVIDANIVVSLLISPGKPLDLFFNEELELFAPKLLFIEIEQNKEEIIRKSRCDEEEIETLLRLIRQRINVVPEEEFVSLINLAVKNCPDPKDIVYFSLSLYLKCPLWSNEKKLKEQNEVTVYATHELIKMFKL
ncbi:MAG: PIN domain-containing protein [Nanoarchaeota archaeon]